MFAKHHVMIGCDVHTQAYTKVLLGEPSMYRHGLANTDRKVTHESYDDMMNIPMFDFEATLSHVMIGCGVVDLVRVIT